MWTKGFWSSTEDNHPCPLPAVSGAVPGLALKRYKKELPPCSADAEPLQMHRFRRFSGKNVWEKGGDGKKSLWTGKFRREQHPGLAIGQREQVER